ncbi:SLC13 family permease [Pararobbsia silviterrae]|uniref:Permease DsdX n=1 Tax=Pararobbsia silviterrae TaxID=1792498 RepID=A0A494XKI8_9BURK|nr:SLC13 family permease [Pararobbsia silviterrae]RKP48584.1 permease DsdX [Pararobbsia silviterrae]
MGAVHGTPLLIEALVAIVALIVLIARFKINPFIVLLVVSLALAVAAGMPMEKIVKAFETGVGGTLGHIALVIGLGTMLGKMMAESGGAERIATTLIGLFGEEHVHWAMMCIAIIVGLPVFFEVGFVLLIPIAFNLAQRTGKSMVLIGVPMIAGLSIVHGLIPPHPAALLAVQAFHADIGKTIAFGLLIGIPIAIVAGPLFALSIYKHIHLNPDNAIARQFIGSRAERGVPGEATDRRAASKAGAAARDAGGDTVRVAVARDSHPYPRDLPSFGITLFTVLLPVALMLIGSWADLFTPAHSLANDIVKLLGNSVVALLVAVLVSFWTFGGARGFDREQILKFVNESLGPIAGIVLVIGAGGGFGAILRETGISQQIIDSSSSLSLSPLVLGWLVAALIRLATGSATVAMTTACGIVAPLATSATAAVRPELLVLSTGAGSLIFSHVNDAGFWLVKEYFGMTISQTFKTWSLCETIISVMGLVLTLGLASVF